MLERVRAGRGARGDAELLEDVLNVAGNGVLADHERSRDLLVALSARNEAEHLQLATCQAVCVA